MSAGGREAGGLLAVRDLEAGHGSVQALWGLSLTVQAGEICCVLGPNGAGKTTLARVVSGAQPAWAGDIAFDGRAVTRAPPESRARAGIAHVPQGRRVFPELTVHDNLRVARFAATGRADPTTAGFIYDLFPKLIALQRMPAGKLSGGEQQMLAIARGLMTEPKLLVLDEPSLGLAPVLVTLLYQAIDRIRARGVAILLIEQAVEAALTVADRVVVIEAGRLAASGSAQKFSDTKALAAAYLGGRFCDDDRDGDGDGERR